MTTQASIKNYGIAIASPLLKSPVAKMERDREEKNPLAPLRLFYCRDDLQMGLIRLSFWSYLGNMGGPSTVQPSWDRMKDAFNTFDWWRRRKWESRRIWIVSWYNAREPWHYVSCEVIIDVALSRIDNPKTRCAAIPSKVTDCGAGESVLSVDKRLIRACMSFLWLSFQSNGGGRDSLLFSTRFFFFFFLCENWAKYEVTNWKKEQWGISRCDRIKGLMLTYSIVFNLPTKTPWDRLL